MSIAMRVMSIEVQWRKINIHIGKLIFNGALVQKGATALSSTLEKALLQNT
jgi:hypothetical protein